MIEYRAPVLCTMCDAVIGILLFISRSVYHTSRTCTRHFSYGRAINIYCIVANVYTARCIGVINVIHLRTTIDNTFNLGNARPRYVTMATVYIRIINYGSVIYNINNTGARRIIACQIGPVDISLWHCHPIMARNTIPPTK